LRRMEHFPKHSGSLVGIPLIPGPVGQIIQLWKGQVVISFDSLRRKSVGYHIFLPVIDDYHEPLRICPGDIHPGFGSYDPLLIRF